MQVRSTDADQRGLRLRMNMEVPLWGVLSVIGMLFLSGISLYYSQQRLAERLSDDGIQRVQYQTQITTRLDAITTSLTTGAAKDIEHDFKILALQTELAAVRQQVQTQGQGLRDQQMNGRQR